MGAIRITGGTINAEGGESAPGKETGTPSNWSVVDSLSIAGATVIVYAGKSAGAIHLATGELNIDSSAKITAFALDQAAVSPSMSNLGNGRMVSAYFTENALDGDFYIRSTST